MAVKCKYITQMIEELAPKYLAYDKDNVGLLIGNEEAEISSILVALDIDNDVIDEAVENGCNMIITHHPIIFHPIKTLNYSDFKGRMILRLISANINVYSAHTNLDAARGGINDYLAKSFGLSNITVLGKHIDMPYDHQDDNMENLSYGRTGCFDKPITLRELCNRVKSVLKIECLNVSGNLDANILKVGVCSGDGSDFIKDAYESGCDVYISGDIRYHDACDAKAMGLFIIDAGHFATENIYMPVLGTYIDQKLNSEGKKVNIAVSDKDRTPYARF